MARKKSDTKLRLLDAAAESIARHGFDGMILENIANEVGIRSATIFYHFPGGKSQIYSEVFDKIYRSFSTLLDANLSLNQDPTDTLVSISEAFWLYCQNNQDYVQILFREWLNSSDHQRSELALVVAPVVEKSRSYIAEKQKTKELAQFNIDYFMYSLAAQIFTFYAAPGMRTNLWPGHSNQKTSDEVQQNIIEYIRFTCRTER